jgi:hypothetical protein
MKLFSPVVLGLTLFATSLQAQFVYVANSLRGGLTGYSIGSNGLRLHQHRRWHCNSKQLQQFGHRADQDSRRYAGSTESQELETSIQSELRSRLNYPDVIEHCRYIGV